jgi:hypothetical protein
MREISFRRHFRVRYIADVEISWKYENSVCLRECAGRSEKERLFERAASGQVGLETSLPQGVANHGIHRVGAWSLQVARDD